MREAGLTGQAPVFVGASGSGGPYWAISRPIRIVRPFESGRGTRGTNDVPDSGTSHWSSLARSIQAPLEPWCRNPSTASPCHGCTASVTVALKRHRVRSEHVAVWLEPLEPLAIEGV